MYNFENHPFIPTQSEDHPELLKTFKEWQTHLGNPRIAERIREQEGGAELLGIFANTRIGASGEITMRLDPDDPRWSPEKPLTPLEDDDLRGLDVWAGIAFARAELNPDTDN